MRLPSTMAHYRITAKRGEGGMGAVYRATFTTLNHEAAVQVRPPACADDAAVNGIGQGDGRALPQLAESRRRNGWVVIQWS